MENETAFERCIDFLASMIELYGEEVMQEAEETKNSHKDEEVA